VFERAADAVRQDLDSQMSKIYAGVLVGVALNTLAAIGALGLVVVTDVGYLAYRVLKPGTNH
jgi:hypothetical protein